MGREGRGGKEAGKGGREGKREGGKGEGKGGEGEGKGMGKGRALEPPSKKSGYGPALGTLYAVGLSEHELTNKTDHSSTQNSKIHQSVTCMCAT